MAVLKYRDPSTNIAYPLTSTNLLPGRNVVRNGDMSIWQRGYGPHTSAYACSDGWMNSFTGATPTSVSRVIAPVGSGSALLQATVSGQAATADWASILQRIENVETLAEGVRARRKQGS